MSTNPVLDVSKLPEGKARDKVLTADERTALFKETSKDATLHAFVVVALTTAARAGELTGLVWNDVDLTECMLTFRDTKNGTTRTAWLTDEARKLVSTLASMTAPIRYSRTPPGVVGTNITSYFGRQSTQPAYPV